MSIKVAINGLGRIGRAILKLVIQERGLELIAVNDLVDVENLAYLLRFDTVYGRYSKPVVVEGGHLAVAGRRLQTLRNRDPLLRRARQASSPAQVARPTASRRSSKSSAGASGSGRQR